MAQPAFGSQGRFASTAGCGDALTPFSIGDIARSEDARHGRFRPSRLRFQVTLPVQIELPLQQIGVGGMADGIEAVWEGKSAKEKLKVTVEMSFGFIREQPDTMRFMTSLALQPEVTENLKDLIAKQKLANIEVYAELFKELGYHNATAEAYAFGALIDGTVLGFLALGEDYPLDAMQQKILNKYEL